MDWTAVVRQKAARMCAEFLHNVEPLRHALPRQAHAAGKSGAEQVAELANDRQFEHSYEDDSPNETLCVQCGYQTGAFSSMKGVRFAAPRESNSFRCSSCGRQTAI